MPHDGANQAKPPAETRVRGIAHILVSEHGGIPSKTVIAWSRVNILLAGPVSDVQIARSALYALPVAGLSLLPLQLRRAELRSRPGRRASVLCNDPR